MIEPSVARCRYATPRVYASVYQEWRKPNGSHAPDVYRVFTKLWQERRLDTQRVFLYKGMPRRDVKTAFDKACKRAGVTNLRLHGPRHSASTNLRRAGVDATTAMKIVGHKSERMHRRYNTVEPEDLRRAISQLAAYHANTVITPEMLAAGTENIGACFSSSRP
jgi:integrase